MGFIPAEDAIERAYNDNVVLWVSLAKSHFIAASCLNKNLSSYEKEAVCRPSVELLYGMTIECLLKYGVWSKGKKIFTHNLNQLAEDLKLSEIEINTLHYYTSAIQGGRYGGYASKKEKEEYRGKSLNKSGGNPEGLIEKLLDQLNIDKDWFFAPIKIDESGGVTTIFI